MTPIYEIRKDVPIPSDGGKQSLCATLKKMTCGDSIIIPADQHLSVHSSARSVGAKVKTKSNKDGTVTVWRVDELKNLSKPTAGTGYPVPPGYPKIERTVAEPSMNLPAGYYIQEDPFSSQLWREGEPPATSLTAEASVASEALPEAAMRPGPVAPETISIFGPPTPKPKITIFE